LGKRYKALKTTDLLANPRGSEHASQFRIPESQSFVLTSRVSVTVLTGISGTSSLPTQNNPFPTLCIRRRLNRVSSPHIVHTTDATFSQDVLKSDKPVLLDFWAEWCGPCKMIAPILDEIATEYQDRIKIAKLNIDENPQTPPKFGIRGIPTLILFKN